MLSGTAAFGNTSDLARTQGHLPSFSFSLLSTRTHHRTSVVSSCFGILPTRSQVQPPLAARTLVESLDANCEFFPRGGTAGPNDPRRGRDGVFLPPATRNAGLFDDHSIQALAPAQPTNNYPSSHDFIGSGDNWIVHHGFPEGSGYESHFGFTSLRPPPPVTHHHSHHPAVGIHGQENPWNGRQDPHNAIPRIPQNAAGLSEGISRVMYPPEVMESTYGNMTGNLRHGRERLTPANLQLDCAVHHDWSGTVDARQIQIDTNGRSTNPSQAHGAPALLINYASSSGGGPHQYRTRSRRGALAPFLPRGDGLEPSPFIMTGYTPPQIGESGGRPDPVEHIKRQDIRRPSHRGSGDGGSLARPSRHTVGVRGSRKAEETIDVEIDVPSRKRVRRSSPGAAPDAVMPIITRGSGQFKRISQTPYASGVRQDGWIRQPPIDFGWLHLTDAENSEHTGFAGHNDKVFDFEDVGSSILCRLNFSGRELGKWRILTTNTKNARGSITKGKLAFEVAKLVKRNIEGIKAQTGCGGATFENAVLTRLRHVSKSSWQPDLWYEVSTPGHNSP